jgi:TPR repeat protein
MLFKRGCEGGNGAGCYDLAVMYASGRGVKVDQAQAAALFRRGCEQQHQPSCDALKAASSR